MKPVLNGASEYKLDFLSPQENGTEPGFTSDCRVLGITSHFVCEGLTEALLLNDAVTGDLGGEFSEAASPAVPCSGAGAGVTADIISEPAGDLPITDPDGSLLAGL
jgi:hypothetical protein